MFIEYKLEPYKRIGEYYFGMSRDAIKEIVGNSISTTKYGYPLEDRILDDYGFLYILYDNKSLFEAIEIYPEYTKDVIIFIYKDIKAEISTNIEQTMSALKKISDDFIWEEDSYSSENLGMKVFCPDGKIENILIYDKQYYD